MSEPAAPFKPLNDLERALVAVQKGQISTPRFMDKLLASQILILIDKEVGDDGIWDDGTSPLVVFDAQDKPLLAMFTAPERTGEWPKLQPQFSFGLIVDFAWMLRGVAAEVGIVVNPGLNVGFEMPASGVSQLKQRLQKK